MGYTLKLKADGSLDRYNARLVAKDYSQMPGLDCTHTFSLVAKLNLVWILLPCG